MQNLPEIEARLRGPLSQYARRLLRDGNFADVEDAVQETWVSVLRSPYSFDETRPVEPYLFRICRNRCFDISRKRRELECLEDTIGKSREAWQEASDRELRAELVMVVNGLPEKWRQAIELVYYKGMSFTEAAKHAGVPAGTFKSRIHSMLQFLEEYLECLVGQKRR